MSNLKASADSLIAEVTAALKKSLHDDIAPIIKRITDAAAQLSAALGSQASAPAAAPTAVARRRGRPRKTAAAAAKPAPAALRPRVPGKKNPRGSTRQAIASVLAGANKGLSLAEVRNGLLEMPAFRGRNPKILYTQVVQAIKKMANVHKTVGGLHSIKGGRGAK